MIELKEWDYNLLKRIEKANCTDYRITEIRGNYYINQDDLFVLIDDTQDYRDYAEQKLSEVSEAYDNTKKEDIPGLEKSLQAEVDRLKEENENLKEENEILRNKALFYCNEDMLDRLAEEGVQL